MGIKNLTNVLLSGTLIFSEIGCSNGSHPEYNFSGKIGEEQINYHESFINGTCFLDVKTANGSKIRFADSDGDLRLEYVEITVGNNTTKYYRDSKNPATFKFFTGTQEKFNWYLETITEIQTAPLYSTEQDTIQKLLEVLPN